MNRIVKGLVAIVGMMGLAGWVYAAGDAEAGKAKAGMCAACHGVDGNSAMPAFPKLAGQNARYLIKQLKDIKSGARSVPVMAGMVAGLSLEDMTNIAVYYAGQKVTIGAVKPEYLALGEKIYRAGNASTEVPACSACHGATGKGMVEAGFPAIGGQHADYLEMQLKAFRAAGREDEAGTRRSNDDGMMMQSVSARLSDAEIKALSSYINGLY